MTRPSQFPNATEQPASLTAAELARLLHCSTSSVNEWRRQGRLTAFQTPGGGWRYPVAQQAVQDAQRALAGPRRAAR